MSVREPSVHLLFIHSFHWRVQNVTLPFSGASSIPLCYIPFPSTLFHQLVIHPPSLHLAICFLIYLSASFFPNLLLPKLLWEICNHGFFYLDGGLAHRKTFKLKAWIFNQGLLPYMTCFHHSFQSVIYLWSDFGVSFY